MDDDIYMILIRTHPWAVHLVQHLITTSSDKKGDGHLVSFFVNIYGAKRKHIYGDSFQTKYKNSVPRELVKSNIPSHPWGCLYAVYCVMTLHRNLLSVGVTFNVEVSILSGGTHGQISLYKSGLSLRIRESREMASSKKQRKPRVEIDAAVTY